MAERDNDKWLERLLRPRSARAATPSDACLDAETMAAWVDGSLNAKELAAAELHASNCSRCTSLLATIGRTAQPAPVASRSRSGLFRWLVPLAAAATAVAIWVVIPQQKPVTSVPSELEPRSVAVAPPMTAPPPPSAAPVAPQAQSEVGAARQQRARRLDDLSARAEDERRQEPSREGMTVAVERPADRLSQEPAASPKRENADSVGQRAAAALERQSLNETVAVVVQGISPDDPQIRWRSPSGAEIERSTDGGQTWTKTPSNPPGPIAAIRAVSAREATATTSDGRRFSTTDSGATWVPVQEKPQAPF